MRSSLKLWSFALVLLLATTHTIINYHFVLAYGDQETFENIGQMYKDIAYGNASHDFQARPLMGFIYIAAKKLVNNPKLTFLLVQWLTAIFSLLGVLLFLQLHATINRAYAGLLILSVFFPLSYVLMHRLGESLLFGFLFWFLYFLSKGNLVMMFVIAGITAFQRPDVGALFPLFLISWRFEDMRKQQRSLLCLGQAVAIGLLVILLHLLVKRYYGVKGGFEFYIGNVQRFDTSHLYQNIKCFYHPLLLFNILWVTPIFLWKKMKWKWRLILLSAIPHLIMITILGGFGEARLFLPVIAILIAITVVHFDPKQFNITIGAAK